MTATLTLAPPPVPHPAPHHRAPNSDHANSDHVNGNDANGNDANGNDALPALSRDEVLRYSRHLILPDVGLEGQQKLKAARVLLVGAGGLGSPAALYLAA